MRQQASFDEHGEITFEEFKHKPVDTSQLQGAMFADRPDLWKRKSKRAQKPALNQARLEKGGE